ncbi:MAG: methyltransferase domain-containing protein [Planctomycetes bacterium]|nr:methyltransferase domain-containing protein [Planctomycetota bacterium]
MNFTLALMNDAWAIPPIPDPTLPELRRFAEKVAADLDPGSRYIAELFAVFDASSDAADLLARLADPQRTAVFQTDGSQASAGERGFSWVDPQTWEVMNPFERVLSNLLTGETRMMWSGEGAPEFRRFPEATAAHPREQPFRVASIPCSTGKEAFSLVAAGLEAGLDVHVTGVDRQPAYVERARSGRLVVHGRDWDYPRAGTYLQRSGQGPTTIRDAVRARLDFEQGDVLTGALPEGPFDLVSCRNLLGYFRGETLERAWTHVAARVKPGGLLLHDAFVCSSAEMAPVRALLEAAGYRRLFPDASYFRRDHDA